MVNKVIMKGLTTTATIFLYFLLVKGNTQNQECRVDSSFSFPVQPDEQFSFSSEIKKNGGLVMDINYVDRPKERIILDSNKSLRSMHDGEEYIEIDLNPLLTEGRNNIDVIVEKNHLRIITNSSKIPPLEISIHSRIKSITVLSENLNVCEERCNIETNIEKTIQNGEKFQMIAFTTSSYPITFDIFNSKEDETISSFVMMPRNCILTQKQTNRTITCNFIDQGWNKFDIFVNRSKLIINNHTIPIDVSMKSLNISGNHLVNCKKGTPLWKISNGKQIPIPIALDQEIVFILTSNASFSPAFEFDGNKMLLSWNNGVKAGSSGKPLMPKSYHLIFEIRSGRFRIYNEKKSDTLVDLKIEKVPEYILASSLKGIYWVVLSLESPLKESNKIYPTAVPSVVTNIKQDPNILDVNTPVTRSIDVTGTTQKNSNSNSPYVIAIVILSLLLVATLAFVVIFIWKKKEIFKRTMYGVVPIENPEDDVISLKKTEGYNQGGSASKGVEDGDFEKGKGFNPDNADCDEMSHNQIKVEINRCNVLTPVASDKINISIPVEAEIKVLDGSHKTHSTLKIYEKSLYIKGHTTENYRNDMNDFETIIKQNISNLKKIQISDEDCCSVTFTSTISQLKDDKLDALLKLSKDDFLKNIPISGIPIFSPFKGSTMLNPWIYSIQRILKSPYTLVSQIVIDKMAAANPKSVNEQSKGVKLQEHDDETHFNAVIPVFPPNLAAQMNNIMRTNIYAMCCTYALLKSSDIIDFDIHMAALGIAWVRMLYENPVKPRPEYVQYRIKCIEATARQYFDRRSFANYSELLIKNPVQAIMTESTIEVEGKTVKCESLVKPMFFLHLAVLSKQISDNKMIKKIVKTILVEYIGRCLSKGIKQNINPDKKKTHSDFFTELLTDENNKNMDLNNFAKEIKVKIAGSEENLLKVFYYEEQCKKGAKKAIKEVMKSSYFELYNKIPMKVIMSKVNQLRNVSSCGDLSWNTLKTFAKEVGLPGFDIDDLFNDENVFLYVSHAFRYTNSRERLQIPLPDYNVCSAEIAKACAIERSKHDTEKLVKIMVDSWLNSYKEAHSCEVQPMIKSQIIQEAKGKKIDVNDENFDQVYKKYRPDEGFMGNACQSRSCPWFLKPMNTYNEHARARHANACCNSIVE